MAKQNKSHVPQPGKCDIIEGILIGNNQTHALNRKCQDDLKPDFMIKRLRLVAKQSSCTELTQQAERAAQLLEKLPGHVPVNDLDRQRILKEVCDTSAATA